MRKLLSFKNTRRETIILDSCVEMIWWMNKQRYIDLGYTYTGHGDKFLCDINDLPAKSNVRVNVRCPICKEVRDIVYRTIERVGHTICKGCAKTWDLTGMRFGKLIALEIDLNTSVGKRGAWWLCQCDCGRVHSVKSDNLLSGGVLSCGCYATELLRAKTGENNPMWKPDLADEERKYSRNCPEYNAWRRAVLKRDKKTCQVCKKKKRDGIVLNAHHIYSYKHYPEYQTEAWNGIALCEGCHINFHVFMGGNSTKCTLADFCDWLIKMS